MTVVEGQVSGSPVALLGVLSRLRLVDVVIEEPDLEQASGLAAVAAGAGTGSRTASVAAGAGIAVLAYAFNALDNQAEATR